MVGIVLVSHSRALAESVQELVRAMTGPGLRLAAAAGAGDDHKELGTDAVEIADAITAMQGPDGVLVLMDMGSAILSSETALDLLDDAGKANVRFCSAPFVEGAVAAGVTANLGAPIDEVFREALAALKQKENALGLNHGVTPAAPAAPVATPAAAPATNGHANGAAEKLRVLVRNEHGLHARPAAQLIKEARPFQAEITVSNLSNRRGPVSIRSLSGLASLEILKDNEIEFAATGQDAHTALEKMVALVEGGLGDDLPRPSGPAPKKAAPAARKAAPAGPAPVAGTASTTPGPIPISSGIAVGPATYAQAAHLNVPTEPASDVAAEVARLRTAVAVTQKALEARRDAMRGTVGEKNAGIYDAQVMALQDPELTDSAVRLIRDEQLNAAQAWDRANRQIIAQYEALQDPYLRERAIDLEDVGQQVLEQLVGPARSGALLAEPGILIADNLTPYQVSTLDLGLVRGVVLLDGGPTAHSSILLRSLGVPAVVQARGAFAGSYLGHPLRVALDGASGQVWINPDDAFTAQLEGRQAEQRRRDEEERAASAEPAATRDGQRVEVFANIGDVADIEPALHRGAEGVGLLRTEFLFLDRATPPTEEEQVAALRAMVEKMGGRTLIVRTLDAGGDKALPYLDMAAEENPFLGVRALRLCFSHKELFATQLRAILRAGVGGDVRIMFPMVAGVADLDRALDVLEQIHRGLDRDGVPHLWPVQTGIMVEIPSAALLAGPLAEKADFFSIGTNDLTQYTLAADRGNPELAPYQDALHPAVLRLIELVCAGARQHNRLVAVCGEAAADEQAAAIFVGLGVRELSLSSGKIPHLKACLRRQGLAGLQKLAAAALTCRSAAEVRVLQPGV